jgi:hypothetical protein
MATAGTAARGPHTASHPSALALGQPRFRDARLVLAASEIGAFAAWSVMLARAASIPADATSRAQALAAALAKVDRLYGGRPVPREKRQ